MARSAALLASIELPEGKSLEDVLDAVRAAAMAKYPSGCCYVEATNGQTVVVDCGADGMFRHEWTMDAAGAVTLSAQAEKVVEQTTYKPVAASALATVIASVSASKLRVRVIGTGFGANSENGRKWYVPDTADGIGSAVKTFGGARVKWHADGAKYDHVEASFEQWAGTTHDVGYLSNLALAADGLEADLNLDADCPPFVRAALVERQLGLSIEAYADRRESVVAGVPVVELVNFRHRGNEPVSVAIVSHPALRGEVLRVAASRKESVMNREQALAVLASTTSTPEQVAEALKVLASTQAAAPTSTATATIDPEVESAKRRIIKAAEDAEAETRKLKVSGARSALAEKLAVAKLPPLSVKRIERVFAATLETGTVPDDAAITAEVTSERDLLKSVDAKPAVYGGVQIGTEPRDRLELRLENLFGRNDPAYRKSVIASRFGGGKTLPERLRAAGMSGDQREGSFLRIFREHTGHEFADLQTAARGREVRASILSTTFDDAWENVLNRRFIASFENPDYSAWRKMARIVPVSNFVKQERMVKGGYANLATVTEGANYPSMTTPADQGHGYTPTKKGGTEDITWEAILRDDVGALDIGPSMGMAAARTLYEFVFDLYRPGTPTVTMDYDSVALYHASHSNLGSTALASAELIVAYKAMLKFADISNSKRLMVTPKYLLVPIDLMNTAFDLLKSLVTFPGGSTTDNEFIRQMQLEAIVVRHWTDTNDWALVADPFQYPAAEIGFLGGNEEPELFTQDDRNIGSFFNADKVTYKIRHPYGGTVLRHETVYGEVV